MVKKAQMSDKPESQKRLKGIKSKNGLTGTRVVLSLNGENSMPSLAILWKGRDYDQGEETPLAELRKKTGVFELRHVGDRLPVPKAKVRSLFKNKASSWAKCFHAVNLGTTRNTLFIDLNMFMEIWDKKMKDSGIRIDTPLVEKDPNMNTTSPIAKAKRPITKEK